MYSVDKTQLVIEIAGGATSDRISVTTPRPKRTVRLAGAAPPFETKWLRLKDACGRALANGHLFASLGTCAKETPGQPRGSMFWFMRKKLVGS